MNEKRFTVLDAARKVKEAMDLLEVAPGFLENTPPSAYSVAAKSRIRRARNSAKAALEYLAQADGMTFLQLLDELTGKETI